MIDLYSKPNCLYCDQAKSLLNKHNKPYNEIAIGESILIEELQERFPAARAAPVVVINGIFIGGYPELKKLFEGLDSGFTSNPEFLTE